VSQPASQSYEKRELAFRQRQGGKDQKRQTWNRAQIFSEDDNMSQWDMKGNMRTRRRGGIYTYSYLGARGMWGSKVGDAVVHVPGILNIFPRDTAGAYFTSQDTKIMHNVFIQRVARISECRRILLATTIYLQHNMSLSNNVNSVYHEDAVELALTAFQSGQFRTQKAAADAFNVRLRTLNRRVQGISARRNCTPNNQKLTTTEEKTII
jgi:hypothetical protein